ncbi:Uncharacterized protein APZ42_003206, partial [Daphnia magna]
RRERQDCRSHGLRGPLHDRIRHRRLPPRPGRCGPRHLQRNGGSRRDHRRKHDDPADRRCRHRLWRAAERAPHRAGLRGGRCRRYPDRRPGDAQ